METKFKLNTNDVGNSVPLETFDFNSLRKQTLSIEDLLIICTEADCSDLYIKTFERPYISRYGKIFQIPCTPITNNFCLT